mgnify:CR=1 FL=1
MNKDNIVIQIERINTQISILSNREYNPDMSTSDEREIHKRKKKLNKSKKKLKKRLDSVQNTLN